MFSKYQVNISIILYELFHLSDRITLRVDTITFSILQIRKIRLRNINHDTYTLVVNGGDRI